MIVNISKVVQESGDTRVYRKVAEFVVDSPFKLSSSSVDLDPAEPRLLGNFIALPKSYSILNVVVDSQVLTVHVREAQ